MDTAGNVLQRCPSYRESDKESKDRDELLVSVLQRCPSYRECIEVSVTSESTVVTDRYLCQGIGKAAEKELMTNFFPTELCPLNIYHKGN